MFKFFHMTLVFLFHFVVDFKYKIRYVLVLHDMIAKRPRKSKTRLFSHIREKIDSTRLSKIFIVFTKEIGGHQARVKIVMIFLVSCGKTIKVGSWRTRCPRFTKESLSSHGFCIKLETAILSSRKLCMRPSQVLNFHH